jgi:hypothetical protein
MRKFIEISEEVYQRLMEGKYVDGSMHLEKPRKLIVFNNYKRTKPRKYPIEILGRTDFGKVYRTRKRTKWSENMPTNLGAVHMARIMERDCKQAQEIIATAEIIDNV